MSIGKSLDPFNSAAVKPEHRGLIIQHMTANDIKKMLAVSPFWKDVIGNDPITMEKIAKKQEEIIASMQVPQ